MTTESNLRPALVTGGKTKEDVTKDVLRPIGKVSNLWLASLIFSILLILFGGYCVWRTWWSGIGMWGENKSVNWAWDITNFVWWIGIGHAGTFISAILLLFRQKWRNAINRSAEAMTLIAITCSAFFIIAHLGRPWLAYWVFPFPNTYGSLWPNFNSALVWDAFAIAVYFIVSFIFWYCGVLPDFATLRDQSTGRKKKLFKILSFSWDSSSWTWRRYDSFMKTTAGIATALVISVHSIVAMDFATTLIPGWHSTIFPPYFVIGAIYSGLAMTLTLLIIVRRVYHLEDYITITHIDFLNQLVIVNSGLLIISYGTEFFSAFHGEKGYESYVFNFRMFGHYYVYFIAMMVGNVLLPQLLWIKSLRRNILFSFILSIIINVAMWSERFVIIVTSLSRGFLPSSWVLFSPTLYDIGTFVFTLGLFLFMFLLFSKYLPVINISEVKSLVKKHSGRKK